VVPKPPWWVHCQHQDAPHGHDEAKDKIREKSEEKKGQKGYFLHLLSP